MDPIYRYNKARWEGLVEAGALFTRPWLGLTPEAARRRIDPEGLLGDVVVWMPPLTIRDADIQVLEHATIAAIRDCC